MLKHFYELTMSISVIMFQDCLWSFCEVVVQHDCHRCVCVGASWVVLCVLCFRVI